MWNEENLIIVCHINGSFSHVQYTMGAIASVLQWHCTICSLINPTERIKCIRCGTSRQHFNESSAVPNFNNGSNCTVIKRLKLQTKEHSPRWIIGPITNPCIQNLINHYIDDLFPNYRLLTILTLFQI